MSEQVIKQQTSKQLYHYWDTVRGGRIAPNRFEIEPADISAILAETFIIDCSDAARYRFRLAGTQICERLGRELRGVDLLEFWDQDDREALEGLIHGVVQDGSVGVARFSVLAADARRAQFELTLMPLIHSSRAINRILGSITAIDPPYWLGAVDIAGFVLDEVDIVFPDGTPHFLTEPAPAAVFAHEGDYKIAGDNLRRFRVIEGGRSDVPE